MKPEIVRSEKSENKVRKKAPPGYPLRGCFFSVYSGKTLDFRYILGYNGHGFLFPTMKPLD